MPPAMKGRNKKHLQGQGIGLARDKRHEPPPPRLGLRSLSNTLTVKWTGDSECWFNITMTQLLCGEHSENSRLPQLGGAP